MTNEKATLPHEGDIVRVVNKRAGMFGREGILQSTISTAYAIVRFRGIPEPLIYTLEDVVKV
jgi:hypothetical protein